MNEKIPGKAKRVKRPIRRSLLIVMISMFAVLCILLSIIASVFFSKALYAQFDSKLTGVITYVENNIDADDLKTCIDTGVTSAKYDETQQLLNKLVDSIDVEYIYIIIPKETVLVNAITSTSTKEFEEGQDNLPILFEADWFTKDEVAKFKAFWGSDGINFFEETDSYEGTAQSRYTACKPLKTSNGQTIALICVDLDSTDLRAMVTRTVVISIIIVAVVFVIFGLSLILWIYRNITGPLRALESSANEFASGTSGEEELKYKVPVIRSENEVRSLGDAIKKMTDDIRNYIADRDEKEMIIRKTEEENAVLAEKAASAAKIAELSQSVSVLLDNMPALTFYKDPETGKYLGCNQSFAVYAGKSDPTGVVGLTDYDLFAKGDADHFIEVDHKTMALDYPYIILETATDANGILRTFQTTKLKFKDSSGSLRLLGMCMDLTDMTSAKRETEEARKAYESAMSSNLTYSSIARALSTDYSYIYYVNIVSGEFAEYKNDNTEESLVITRRGTDFFVEARERALTVIYKDDNKAFIASFTKENVLEKIDTAGAFTATYRQIIDDVPVYVNMKATRIKNDPQHIVVGIYSVDVQMKYKETLERLQEEQTTYSRISALSGDFICIYTVDPGTDYFAEYSVKREYAELGIEKEGDRFFDRCRGDNTRVIWPEDREMYLSMLTKENMLKEIESHGMFTMSYRLNISGSPLYVSLKAAMVKEKDGPQLIIGVINIDAQVKREKEYDYNLSVARSKANIDALTGVKNKHAYIDAEASLNAMIEEGEPPEFALVVFDVNGLKIINDTQGHRAGDELIRGACMIICKQFKHSPVFRIGGDEFAVIVQGQDYESIDDLVFGVEEINLKNKAEHGIIVACGMAKYSGERNVAELFEKADSAMYENKKMLKQ